MACEAECRAFLTIQAGFAFHLFVWKRTITRGLQLFERCFARLVPWYKMMRRKTRGPQIYCPTHKQSQTPALLNSLNLA